MPKVQSVAANHIRPMTMGRISRRGRNRVWLRIIVPLTKNSPATMRRRFNELGVCPKSIAPRSMMLTGVQT